MRKIIFIFCALASIIGCSKQDYYEVPTDANGDILLTGISSTTTTGISTLDGSFSVTATFATAKVGDVMNVELLQLQLPTNGGTTKQLLPLAGTQVTATVGGDMKATVTYTKEVAQLLAVGDAATVVFNGATDYAKQRVELVPATSTTKPKVGDKEVDVARTAETAYFNVTIAPKGGAYIGSVIAKRKNGKNDAWVTIPGPFTGTQPFMVPITGTDFAAGKDTMFYTFAASQGIYSDEISSTIIVRDPYFYVKKAGTLTVGGSSAGMNLVKNASVAENNGDAMISIASDLTLQGGSVWLTASKSISFVPTTTAMYDANNLTNTINAYTAGTPMATANPIGGTGVYIFKVVNGTNVSDVYYGIIKITSVVPNVSATFEYRIGDQYAHLAVL